MVFPLMDKRGLEQRPAILELRDHHHANDADGQLFPPARRIEELEGGEFKWPLPALRRSSLRRETADKSRKRLGWLRRHEDCPSHA